MTNILLCFDFLLPESSYLWHNILSTVTLPYTQGLWERWKVIGNCFNIRYNGFSNKKNDRDNFMKN